MYKNIGHKIQVLAKVIAWIGIALSILGGIAGIIVSITSTRGFGSRGTSTAVIGILGGLAIIAVGFLVSWISSWFMYGFGTLIDNTSRIAENTARPAAPYTAPTYTAPTYTAPTYNQPQNTAPTYNPPAAPQQDFDTQNNPQ